MGRKRIVAGNWKMNLDYGQAMKLARAVRAAGGVSSKKLVVLGVPAVYLKPVADLLSDNRYMQVAAQNCHEAESGAYTGEISAAMLRSIAVDYVILGHSERRELYGEGSALLKEKVDRALAHGLKPIFCCGEPLGIRKGGQQEEYVANQLKQSLFHLNTDQMAQLVIAYEPIWAIGTGETASPAQAQEMHASIRELIATKYGKTLAEDLTILYGGSVKPANAAELFAQPDVDGGLVGGASLKAEDFCAILTAL